MIKKLFISCFTLLSQFALASTVQIYTTPAEAPLELKYLIESIQLNKTKDFKNDLIILDQLMSQLSKKELFFIVKSESYKSILKVKPQYLIKKKYYQSESFSLFEKKVKTFEANSSFSSWVIQSIYRDLKEIFTSSQFNTYMNKKKKGETLSAGFQSIEKKLNLLLPWYGHISTSTPKEFEEDMLKLMMDLFNKLIIYTKQFLSYSRFEILEITPLKEDYSFFEKIIVNHQEIKNQFIHKIDNNRGNDFFISDLNEDIKQELPKTKEKRWMPKDNNKQTSEPTQAKIKKIFFPKANPNYKIPKDLPSPIFDWPEKETSIKK